MNILSIIKNPIAAKNSLNCIEDMKMTINVLELKEGGGFL